MKSKGNTQTTEAMEPTNVQTIEATILNPIETPTNERKYITKIRRKNQDTNNLMTLEQTDTKIIEAFNKVLTLIEDKGYGIAKACKNIKNIDTHTFYDVVDFNAQFLQQYIRSQELRAEKILQRMDKYVHDTANDTYTNERGIELPNAVKVQRNRLMYDMDKWHLSKLNPKKYGDNITVKGDADNPLQIVAIKGMIIQ